ncbi:hypothetical protein CDL15_Pgr017342 [Punica granatum]|uniref:Uncharacterized protein n=1 Tax=Punica granatum TaxID=22663 RepID=A0A218Y2K0_PUNGR|nr:hypothetical protein CDL15_Pgr017342 [Punica granatum]
MAQEPAYHDTSTASVSRRNTDQSLPEEEIVLENWVYDCFLAGELHRLVDEEEGVHKRKAREDG